MRLARNVERLKELTDDSIFAFWDTILPDQLYTGQQQQILQAVQDSTLYPKASTGPGCDFIAAKSGQGIGKTRALAVVALWRTWRRWKARTYMTAPSLHQAQSVFLTELRDIVDSMPEEISRYFEVTNTKAILFGVKDWEIRVKTASKDTGIQGLHHPHLTVLADEAPGIDRAIMEALEGTCTESDNLFVLTGNPNTRDSYFFDCFNLKRDYWKTLTFSSLESPIVDELKLLRDLIIYGLDSDYVRVRILGEFPRQDPNVLFNSDDLDLCTRVPLRVAARAKLPGEMPVKQIGIDVARMGGDKSTIFRRYGLGIAESEFYNKAEPLDVVERAMKMQHDAGWSDADCFYAYDAGGMGQPLARHFSQANKKYYEFHFGGNPRNKRKFYDRATEAYFFLASLVKESAKRIREANDPEAGTVLLPSDPELIHQLCTRQYHMAAARGGSRKAVFKLEDKETYRKRIAQTASADTIKSPDKADGAVIAFYPHVQTSIEVASGQPLGRESEFDKGRRRPHISKRTGGMAT